ncbi:MAG: IclR family transcriptional regulator [Burkholderiales bacterium]
MTKSRRGIQSIEVGGALLAALVDAGAPLPLRDLAQRAGMSSAKAHPYLVSYGKLRLIEQDPLTGHYGLGPFALQMGLVSLQLLSPVRVAIPAITTLGDATGQTVALAVLGTHGPTIVYIHESARPIHVNMRAGTVMSTLNTATGRVFSAWLPPRLAQHHVARELRDPAVTAQASARRPREEIEALLADVRRRGLARAVGEPIPGINALSAPVFDHTGALALAVTAIGPAGSFDPAWDGALARDVRSCAAEVSRRLGFRPRDA